MKTRFITALASIILLAATVRGEETFDEAMKRAAADYGERLRKAADELNSARKRIADEKAPFLKEIRSAEDRIVTAQSEIERLEAGQQDVSEQRRKLLMELDAARKNSAHLGTLAHDGLTAFGEGFAPAAATVSWQSTALGTRSVASTGAGGRPRATVPCPSARWKRGSPSPTPQT